MILFKKLFNWRYFLFYVLSLLHYFGVFSSKVDAVFKEWIEFSLLFTASSVIVEWINLI